MPKNIIICCDGTGNEVEEHLSNVLKLYRVLLKNKDQVVFYDPGIGTLSSAKDWGRYIQKARQIFSLCVGFGLDKNVIRAYQFLVQNYEKGDQVYLFGFSRGAYTVRVLAGFLSHVGLLKPEQFNLCNYAFKAYKQSSLQNNLNIGSRFQTITTARRIPIKFIGVWDTVSSVLIPLPSRIIPGIAQQKFPYTAKNPNVKFFRQAIAIDEFRRMFRVNKWQDHQLYKVNPFSKSPNIPQDIKQVWFSGNHSDVGGGYPEEESGLAKYSLSWMIDQAKSVGLKVNTARYNHLVLGKKRKGSTRQYSVPSATAKLHNSMTGGWIPMEWIPRRNKHKEWKERKSILGFYLPMSEPRYIPENALIHFSVKERIEKESSYQPINLPNDYQVVK